MKILLLTHEYPPIGGGGGQACKNIVSQLTQRGDEITVLTAYMKSLPKEEKSNNLRIFRLPSLRKRPYKVGLIGMGAFIVISFFSGLKIIRDWKPQIIHAHFAVPAGFVAYLLSTLTGIPYIITAHLGDIPGGVPEKTDVWFRWLFPFTIPVWKHAAKIVCVSDFTASLARENYNVEAKVIPNGIELAILKNTLNVHAPPTIFFAGRFAMQKNLFALVDILDSVRDLDWKCFLLGDGTLYSQVISKLNSYHLQERFYVPGWVTPEVVQEYLQKSDILLMPSLSEGLSVIGVQALANGLAILANNVGGFSELVINNHNGVLANVGNTAPLLKMLRRYLTYPNILMNARLSSLEIALKFDIKKITDQYEEIFSFYAMK